MQNNKNMVIACPHCQKAIEIWIHPNKSEIPVTSETPGFPIDPLKDLTSTQRKMIQTAVNNGTMIKFRACVEEVKRDEIPKSIEKFFVTIFKTGQFKTVPRSALTLFYKYYGGTINYFASQSIGVVIADGMIRAFVPDALVFGNSTKMKILGGSIKSVTPYDEITLEEWFQKEERFLSIGQRASFSNMRSQSHGG